MKKTWEQTADDMDERFASGGFSAAGGNMQSLTFAFQAMQTVLYSTPLSATLKPLCEWTSTPIKNSMNTLTKGKRALIYDMGCAEGDGTAVLSYFFPLSIITGIDISPVAIERARSRWPHLAFRVGDITQPDFDRASIIYTSHTIEHMEFPAEVIQGLLARCSILLVVVPPVPVDHKQPTHVGATGIVEWLPLLPKPLVTANYDTIRPNLDAGGTIVEGNILLAWRGHL